MILHFLSAPRAAVKKSTVLVLILLLDLFLYSEILFNYLLMMCHRPVFMHCTRPWVNLFNLENHVLQLKKMSYFFMELSFRFWSSQLGHHYNESSDLPLIWGTFDYQYFYSFFSWRPQFTLGRLFQSPA